MAASGGPRPGIGKEGLIPAQTEAQPAGLIPDRAPSNRKIREVHHVLKVAARGRHPAAVARGPRRLFRRKGPGSAVGWLQLREFRPVGGRREQRARVRHQLGAVNQRSAECRVMQPRDGEPGAAAVQQVLPPAHDGFARPQDQLAGHLPGRPDAAAGEHDAHGGGGLLRDLGGPCHALQIAVAAERGAEVVGGEKAVGQRHKPAAVKRVVEFAAARVRLVEGVGPRRPDLRIFPEDVETAGQIAEFKQVGPMLGPDYQPDAFVFDHQQPQPGPIEPLGARSGWRGGMRQGSHGRGHLKRG